MKKTLFVLLVTLLTLACSSPDREGYHGVMDLSQSVRPPILSAVAPVVGLSRNWINPDEEQVLTIEGSVKILVYIPKGERHKLSLSLMADRPAKYSFFLDGVRGESKRAAASFPAPSPGTHEIAITASRRVRLRTLLIRWGSWQEKLGEGTSIEIIAQKIGIYELLHHFTVPMGRDHAPALLFQGERSLSIPLDDPTGARSFHAEILTLKDAGSVTFTFEGMDNTITRKAELPDAGERSSVDVTFPDGFLLKKVSVSLVKCREETSFVLIRPQLNIVMQSSHPNIILITLDTTRRDALGIYGATPSPTPNLDTLATTSTLFTRAYAPAPWTLPSHASIMTGASPGRHGAGTWASHLGPDLPTLAECFTKNNYITAGFSGGELTKGKFGFSRGFSLYRDPYHFERRADDLTKDVLHFIREHRPIPFFIFINYFDPHAPYDPPERYKDAQGIPDLIKGRSENDPLWQLAQGFPGAWDRFMAGDIPRDEKSLQIIKHLYLAEVAFTDDALGRLIDTLKENEIYRNTLIIVTADHGEFLGEHGLLTHTTRLYEPVIRVPLIVHQPRQADAERIDRLVTLTDIFPTLIRLASLDSAPTPGAEALLQPDHPHTRVMAEEHLRLPVHPLIDWMKSTDHLYTLIARNTKIILNEGGRTELYDLLKDPGETHPLPTDSTPLVKTFRVYVKAERKAWKRTGTGSTSRSLTSEEKKALSSLGYLQ